MSVFETEDELLAAYTGDPEVVGVPRREQFEKAIQDAVGAPVRFRWTGTGAVSMRCGEGASERRVLLECACRERDVQDAVDSLKLGVR